MKRIDVLLADYGSHHTTRGNLACHVAGISLIVFGILAMPQHAVGDPERQRRGLNETDLELAVQLVVHAYKAANQPLHTFMHVIAPILAGRLARPDGSGAGGERLRQKQGRRIHVRSDGLETHQRATSRRRCLTARLEELPRSRSLSPH